MCEVIKENKPQAYVYDWILKTMIQFTFRTMNPFFNYTNTPSSEKTMDS